MDPGQLTNDKLVSNMSENESEMIHLYSSRSRTRSRSCRRRSRSRSRSHSRSRKRSRSQRRSLMMMMMTTTTTIPANPFHPYHIPLNPLISVSPACSLQPCLLSLGFVKVVRGWVDSYFRGEGSRCRRSVVLMPPDMATGFQAARVMAILMVMRR